MKKTSIIIGIVAVLCIILFIIVKINKPKKVTNTNNNNISSNQQQGKIEQFEEQLKEEGITLTNKKEITSEQINENGYTYELNQETIEIYNVKQEKIDNIIEQRKSDYEITIRTMQGDTIDAIYCDEILILNCRKNSEKILAIL